MAHFRITAVYGRTRAYVPSAELGVQAEYQLASSSKCNAKESEKLAAYLQSITVKILPDSFQNICVIFFSPVPTDNELAVVGILARDPK